MGTQASGSAGVWERRCMGAQVYGSAGFWERRRLACILLHAAQCRSAGGSPAMPVWAKATPVRLCFSALTGIAREAACAPAYGSPLQGYSHQPRAAPWVCGRRGMRPGYAAGGVCTLCMRQEVYAPCKSNSIATPLPPFRAII